MISEEITNETECCEKKFFRLLYVNICYMYMYCTYYSMQFDCLNSSKYKFENTETAGKLQYYMNSPCFPCENLNVNQAL